MIHDNEQLDSMGRPRVQTINDDPSETIQSDMHRADIMAVLRQYKEIGIAENLNYAEAQFRDISEFTDFADAMRHAKMAKEEFMKLPSKAREIFHHSVEEWLDAAHDQEKRDALVAAGIIEASPEVIIPGTPPVGPPAPAPTPAPGASGQPGVTGGPPGPSE